MSELNICPNCTGAGGDNNTWICGMCGGTGGVPTASVDAEPVAWLYTHPGAKPLLRHSRFPMSVPGWTETPLYTEAQMQARADAARRETLEEAATSGNGIAPRMTASLPTSRRAAVELIEKMALKMRDEERENWNLELGTDSDVRDLAQAALTALIEHAGGVTEGDREAAATYWEPGLNEDAPDAFARHRATAFAAGRAARDREIVGWLRGQEFNYECGFGDDGVRASAIGMAADAIERGEV